MASMQPQFSPAPQPMSSPPPGPPQPGMHPTPGAQRPVGVTLIGILYALGAAFLLLGGVFMIAAAGIASTMIERFAPEATPWADIGAAFMVVMGFFLIALGVVVLLVTVGFFRGRSWAWTVVLVLEVIGLVVSLLGLVSGDLSNLFWLLVAGLIVWYLFEPAPKSFFGKSHVKAFWQKEKTASG